MALAQQLIEFRRLAQQMEERGQTDTYYHARLRELKALAAPKHVVDEVTL